MSAGEALLLGVIGRPILHSRSPAMHMAALRAAGIPGAYLRIVADTFAGGFALAKEIGLSGVNVTAPFKEEAAKLVAPAARCGAMNTVWNLNRPTGASTDEFGVLQALERALPSLNEVPAVVLGAGGAARAACGALVSAGARVLIAARSGEKAQAIAHDCGAVGGGLNDAWVMARIAAARVIVSCVSDPKFTLPQAAFPRAGVLLNALYGRSSVLEGDGRAAGLTIIPGTEWLLHQGARAFEYFSGVKADVEVMRTAVERAAGRGRPHLALVGLMGAGKSSVAPHLGAQLDRPAVDLDQVIEQRSGQSISEIFRDRGENAFRQLESETLMGALEGPPTVLACGGGIVCRPENLQALQSRATIVWLWASIDELVVRLQDAPHRPLLKRGDPQIVLREMLSDRRMGYAQSDLVVSTSGQSPASIAERIAFEVRSASES